MPSSKNPPPSIGDKVWNPLTLETWIVWTATLVVSSLGALIFFYNHFETKDNFEEYRNAQSRYQELIEKRLDRIENKIDQILTNSTEQRSSR